MGDVPLQPQPTMRGGGGVGDVPLQPKPTMRGGGGDGGRPLAAKAHYEGWRWGGGRPLAAKGVAGHWFQICSKSLDLFCAPLYYIQAHTRSDRAT